MDEFPFPIPTYPAPGPAIWCMRTGRWIPLMTDEERQSADAKATNDFVNEMYAYLRNRNKNPSG